MRIDWRAAAISGDAEAIVELLASGSDVDARDRYGQTALMLAATYGRSTVVSLLVERGADLNITAKYGLSALMLAIVNHHEAIAETLVDAGADLTIAGTGAPGFAGKTARHLAEDREMTALAARIAALEPASRNGTSQMRDQDGVVECPRHGAQPACFVCRHLAASVRTGEVVGYVASVEDESAVRPHAWCHACERIRRAEGGEWNDRSEAYAGVTLICGQCYDEARALNE